MTLFAPNGLLLDSTRDLEDATTILPVFKPSGLLGGGKKDDNQGLESPEETPRAGPSFTLTSLLSKAHTRRTNGPEDSDINSVALGTTSLTFGRTSLLEEPERQVEEALSSVSPSTSFRKPSTLLDSSESYPPETSLLIPPPNAIKATSFNGKTLFLKKRKRTQASAVGISTTTSPFSNLLDTPIHRLLDDLATKTIARLDNPTTRPDPNPALSCLDDALWVDRYRPTCFTDLIGNDRVARETMAWVKQWDHCVFGKTKGKKRRRDEDENANADDEHHRPREKILLLSGPPGLGKTTLAHIVARHAGYDVMEINASDARTGNVVEERIRPALESGSSISSTRPVLLVIDEIDGATGGAENANSFIHHLVQLAQSKPRKQKRPGQKQQPSAQRPLLRPIICICNDINASSLAKLKPHAYQVRFTRPADFHAVRRLREICDFEGLKADTRALNTLVAIAKGDFRGCINTLQFVKSRKEEVTETIIREATVGMKEGDTSIISVLNNIFTPLTKKRVKELAMTEDQESKYVARLSHEIESSGKDATIANGCFEHYATLRQHDANFLRYERANEWLITYDLLSSSMYADGEFALLPYLPYTLVSFYPLFQARGSQRVERSYSDWEHHQLTKSNEGICESFARCLHGATIRQEGTYRHLVGTPVLQLELLPYINRIICPPLRPVNSQVIRPEERLRLARLVDIMTALELRFVQDRGEDGQLSYRLEPPIDVFITYDGKRATDIAVSRYAVRNLVATEVDAKLLGRNTHIIEKQKGRKHHAGTQPSSNDSKIQTDAVSSEPSQKRQKTNPQEVADRIPTDFFGRAITVNSSAKPKSAVRKQTTKAYRVSYKFNEGNSAAVRKPVKLAVFL